MGGGGLYGCGKHACERWTGRREEGEEGRETKRACLPLCPRLPLLPLADADDDDDILCFSLKGWVWVSRAFRVPVCCGVVGRTGVDDMACAARSSPCIDSRRSDQEMGGITPTPRL